MLHKWGESIAAMGDTLEKMYPPNRQRDLMTQELYFIGSLLNQNLLKEQFELQKLLFANVVKTQRTIEPLVTGLWRARDQELIEKLRDPNPLLRWFAADILSRKQLHVEKELIPLLKDPAAEVREAAHQALVRLARGTDFGPKPQDWPANIDKAIARWTSWLAVQDFAAPQISPQIEPTDVKSRPVNKKKD